jgi:cysteine desulfurase
MSQVQGEVKAMTSSPAYAESSSLADAPIFLDANATTRPLDAVIDMVACVMRGAYANPSSAHWLGNEARRVLEIARDDITALFPGIFPEGVIFTSGGTEGNNALLNYFGRDTAGITLITTAVEHHSVLRPAEAFAKAGGQHIVLPVTPDGLVTLDAIQNAVCKARGSVLISVQLANSETGVIQPMGKLIAKVKCLRPDVLVHSDVAQAVGRVPIDLGALQVDVVTFSGHKIHGPQGIGAMVFRDPDERRVAPLILGGGQERGLRSGTHNVAGAAGLGLAARIRASEFAVATSRLSAMRDAFEMQLLDAVPEASVNGGAAPRVPNTSSICFRGKEAMELVARLDSKGIACSVGSACSSAKPEPSHVLMAMGLSQAEAFSSVRFSFSILNSMNEANMAALTVHETLLEMK